MTGKLKQTIKEEVGKLSKENQDVINTFGWEKITEEVGREYSLNESKLTNFQVETLLILTGLEDPNSYAKNIESNVGTSKDEAEKITNEVVQKIFTPINDLLIQNVKKGWVFMTSNTEQNLNFILSGGDYSAFIVERETTPESIETNKTPTSPMITPRLVDIRANSQKTKITDMNEGVKPSPTSSAPK